MQLPGSVTVVEVGPRDGLQNEAVLVPTPQKIELIKALTATGIKRFEATSFVSPKWIPQLADAAEVIAGLPPAPPDVTISMIRAGWPSPMSWQHWTLVFAPLMPRSAGWAVAPSHSARQATSPPKTSSKGKDILWIQTHPQRWNGS